jgi:hypothetical protein
LRFYVDGLELDIQDPTFFMDEEEYRNLNQTLDGILNDYYDLPLDKQTQSAIL